MAARTARIRAGANLRTPDAMQLAVAYTAGCDVVVSNDKQWAGRTGPMRLVGFDG